MDKVNTDISKIPYHKRYKTDEDNYRWVMLEEAKISIESACKDIKAQVIEKDKDINRLKAALVYIANIAHHGRLLNLDVDEIRRVTLPYWDKDACSKLQEGDE